MQYKISSFLIILAFSCKGFDSICDVKSLRCSRPGVKPLFEMYDAHNRKGKSFTLMKMFWERSPKINMCSVGKMKRK